MSLVSAGLLVLAACGGGDASTTTPSNPSSVDATSTSGTAPDSVAPDSVVEDSTGAEQPAVVTISDSRFDMTELRVPVGTTVRFVNTDPYDHTVTSKDDAPAAFASGRLGQDETFEYTFDEPGEYPYFCEIHPTMRASVIVG